MGEGRTTTNAGRFGKGIEVVDNKVLVLQEPETERISGSVRDAIGTSKINAS